MAPLQDHLVEGVTAVAVSNDVLNPDLQCGEGEMASSRPETPIALIPFGDSTRPPSDHLISSRLAH